MSASVQHVRVERTKDGYKFGQVAFDSVKEMKKHFEIEKPVIGGDSGVLCVCCVCVVCVCVCVCARVCGRMFGQHSRTLIFGSQEAIFYLNIEAKGLL